MSKEEIKIELLYFEDCPSWKNGLDNLKSALSSEGLDNSEVQLVLIKNDFAADKERFLGSPSFRLNGQDLWPEKRNSYFLGCRIYATENGMRGYPSIDMIRNKLRTYIDHEL